MNTAKRLIQKAVNHHHHHHQLQPGDLASSDLDLQIVMHYGVPSTASLLAFDSIQRLLAVGTLDGRIKVIGGDGIEGLFVSPNQLPFKYIEFFQNRGFLVSVSNENDIKVWDLESRSLACSFQWESNITSFSVISGSYLIYIGDEHGLMSVLKYDAEEYKLIQLPYQLSPNRLNEAAEIPSLDHQPIVGILPQPCFSGTRVLIAYQNGVVILWDVFEAQILFVGGGKDLELKGGDVDSQNGADSNLQNNISHNQVEEKEITALCWASSSGSILAVGYVDGDIMFWKTSTVSSIRVQQNESSGNNVIKLQLSSAARRLPVIVLHWSASHKSSNDCDGQLYIYGGDEIGAEEVLTILTLEWSSRTEILKCTGRTDLALNGSFADMILLPSAGSIAVNHKVALSVLTNPGQLHVYDDTRLSEILAQKERETSISAVKFSAVVPITDPPMTLAQFASLPMGGNLSRVLSQASGKEWPLTGGVPVHLSSVEHIGVERVYIAGYQDGSVRLWNTLYGVLSLICVLEGKVKGVEVIGFSAPVSAIDFCSRTLNLAVGNECGLVHIYNLNPSSEDTSFHFVTETNNEVHSLPQRKGPQFRAVFSLLKSPVHVLRFAHGGAKLAVGFGCGRVAVLDLISLAVLFSSDCLSSSTSPVVSLTWKKSENVSSLVKNPKHSETDILVNNAEEVLFVLTKDAFLNIVDGSTGSMISSHPWHQKKKSIAISMYVIEDDTSDQSSTNQKPLEDSSHHAAIDENQPMDKAILTGISSHSSEHPSSLDITGTRERLTDPLLLLCCEDSLRLYSTKQVIQGNKKSISKVKHANPCCWVSTLKKDDKVCGLVLLFRTGVIEIRSFPDFELVKEISIMSILRWNFKGNMEKMMSCDNRKITLANGSEMAFISVLADENCLRIPESFPSLHDKVLAAAADAAISFSANQKKKQGTKLGILAGITKGFKAGKTEQTVGGTPKAQTDLSHLESIFLKDPVSDMSPTVTDHQEVIELDIDDIEIDEPPIPISALPHEVKNTKKEKNNEREQLLGKDDDVKPRKRTPEEIRAKYRKAEDASSVAANARNKLLERQEKLERISRRTAELQSGAENFASLAEELVKVMENRKWWQI
ncbi:transducin family protein / WD-40 repeat family protein [Euphorbia peplus]|nr:transducin family protein / WD-40 repeat family protein [Euphorbia peplus]